MRKFFVIMLLAASYVYADVPNEVTYQGRLREYGQPVTGSRTMDFKIYNTAFGPGLVWESGNSSVDVSTGTFSYVLNPSVDWRQKDYWIETVVNGKTLAPREKITAQVYALHARTAEDISKKDNSNISFAIGGNTKATISNSGELSSLVNGTTFYMVPRGAIIMWSGTIASIPAGWALCDGANGTPDLRDRFVMSVNGQSDNPGTIGGTNSITLTTDNLPPHTHDISHTHAGHNHSIDHDHPQVSTSDDGQHNHSYTYWRTGAGGEYEGAGGIVATGTTGNAGLHHHSVDIPNFQGYSGTAAITLGATASGTTGNSVPIDIRPMFFKLAFIMKL